MATLIALLLNLLPSDMESLMQKPKTSNIVKKIELTADRLKANFWLLSGSKLICQFQGKKTTDLQLENQRVGKKWRCNKAGGERV